MKKSVKFIIISCAFIMFIASVLIFYGFLREYYSADYRGDKIYWDGKTYIPCYSNSYTEGDTIAKTRDGGWAIDEVREDPSHTFIVIRSFMDQYLFVRDDYKIPEDGTVTAVFWESPKIVDQEFCKAIVEIYAANGKTFEYQTEGIYMLTDTQYMREVWLSYDNCPIGTKFIGYMGKVNDRWVITTYISSDTRNEDGSPKPYMVTCKEISNKYFSILEKYLS